MNLLRKLQVTVTLMLATATLAMAQNPTPADHPMVSRFAGSTVAEYNVTQFDEFRLILGPFKGGKFENSKMLEGKITHFRYMAPLDHSTLEIFRSYQNALQRAGFEILFACSAKECAEYDSGTQDKWLGNYCVETVSCGPATMRYLSARLSRPTGDVYVSLKVGDTASGFGVGGAFLNIIEERSLDGGLVSANAAVVTTPAPVAPAEPPKVLEPARPAPAVPSVAGITIPAGTLIPIRMIDTIDSSVGHVGDTYSASIAEDVSVGGVRVLPKGGRVTVGLIDDQQAGRLTGKSMLRVNLVSVSVNGRDIPLTSTEYVQSGASKTKRTGLSALLGAGAGTAIGAAQAGGKGAAIGAGTGAAAGVAVQALLAGEKVRIPSETALAFTLQSPVAVTR